MLVQVLYKAVRIDLRWIEGKQSNDTTTASTQSPWEIVEHTSMCICFRLLRISLSPGQPLRECEVTTRRDLCWGLSRAKPVLNLRISEEAETYARKTVLTKFNAKQFCTIRGEKFSSITLWKIWQKTWFTLEVDKQCRDTNVAWFVVVLTSYSNSTRGLQVG